MNPNATILRCCYGRPAVPCLWTQVISTGLGHPMGDGGRQEPGECLCVGKYSGYVPVPNCLAKDGRP
jgi:hypothetical protein